MANDVKCSYINFKLNYKKWKKTNPNYILAKKLLCCNISIQRKVVKKLYSLITKPFKVYY